MAEGGTKCSAEDEPEYCKYVTKLSAGTIGNKQRPFDANGETLNQRHNDQFRDNSVYKTANEMRAGYGDKMNV